VVQLLLALVAGSKDVHELAKWYSDSDEEKVLGVLSGVLLFGPAFLDAALATIDFFVFTLKAKGEAEAFLGSIEGRVTSWCVSVSDACIGAVMGTQASPSPPPPSEAESSDDDDDDFCSSHSDKSYICTRIKGISFLAIIVCTLACAWGGCFVPRV